MDPDFLKRKPLKDWLFFGIGNWREWRGIYATFALGGIYAAIAVIRDLTGLGLVWSAIVVWGIVIVIGVVILLEKARRGKF